MSLRPARCNVVALGCVLAACGSGATEPTPDQIVGTYALQSVAGRPLPTNITGTSTIIVVSRATRTVRADGTCEDVQDRTTSYGPYPPTTGERRVACRWALRGSTVTFEFAVDAGNSYAQPVTTAAVGRDGALTETTSDPNSAGGFYPRVWTR